MTIDELRAKIEDVEKIVSTADVALLDTDKALEVAERGIETGRRLLPRVAFGLLVLGVGAAVVVGLRRRRQAADQWEILEQPDDDTPPAAAAPSVQDVTEAQEDAADLADAADVIDK